jgi:TPR repeat protein
VHGDEGVEPNPRLARFAAEAHLMTGKFLALVDYAELVREEDPARLDELLARAHAAEFREDQFAFALRLRDGRGCRPDEARSLQYFRIAAENGSAEARRLSDA